MGLEYEPLMRNFEKSKCKKNTYKVVAADFVSSTEGTGIVHIAPAYGEMDYQLSLDQEIDFIDLLDDSGYYLEKAKKWLNDLGVRDTDESGIEIWAANKFIAKILEERGAIYKIVLFV